MAEWPLGLVGMMREQQPIKCQPCTLRSTTSLRKAWSYPFRGRPAAGPRFELGGRRQVSYSTLISPRRMAAVTASVRLFTLSLDITAVT
jgi:hypothetical protein